MAPAATAIATASPMRRPPRNVRSIFFNSQFQGNGSAGEAGSQLQFRLLPDNHLGADRDTLVEIGDVGVDQAEAAGRDGGADGVRPVGAVDTVDGGAEVHRARADRVAGAAGHEARQIWLA